MQNKQRELLINQYMNIVKENNKQTFFQFPVKQFMLKMLDHLDNKIYDQFIYLFPLCTNLLKAKQLQNGFISDIENPVFIQMNKTLALEMIFKALYFIQLYIESLNKFDYYYRLIIQFFMNFSLDLKDHKSKIKSALSKYNNFRAPSSLSSTSKKETIPKPPQFFEEVQQIDAESLYGSEVYKDEQTKPSKLNTSRVMISSMLNESIVILKRKPRQKNVNYSVRLPNTFQSEKQILMRSKLEKHTNLNDLSVKTNMNTKMLQKYYKKLLSNKLFLLSLYEKIINKSQIQQKFIIQDILIKKLQKHIIYEENESIIKTYEDNITKFLQEKLIKIRKQQHRRSED